MPPMPKRPHLNASQNSSDNNSGSGSGPGSGSPPPPPTPPPSPPVPPPEPPTARPEVNLNAVERGHPITPLPLPAGLFNFNTNDESPVSSKPEGRPAFFPNAKAAKKLEQGWIQAADPLNKGQTGLYVEDDGPEINVKVIKVGHYEEIEGKFKLVYTLRAEDGSLIKPAIRQRFYEWDFYIPTAPVPFVPGPREQPFTNGGKRKRSKKTQKRKAKRSKTRSKVKRA